MSQSTVANRYALAIFQLARAKRILLKLKQIFESQRSY